MSRAAVSNYCPFTYPLNYSCKFFECVKCGVRQHCHAWISLCLSHQTFALAHCEDQNQKCQRFSLSLLPARCRRYFGNRRPRRGVCWRPVGHLPPPLLPKTGHSTSHWCPAGPAGCDGDGWREDEPSVVTGRATLASCSCICPLPLFTLSCWLKEQSQGLLLFLSYLIYFCRI